MGKDKELKSQNKTQRQRVYSCSIPPKKLTEGQIIQLELLNKKNEYWPFDEKAQNKFRTLEKNHQTPEAKIEEKLRDYLKQYELMLSWMPPVPQSETPKKPICVLPISVGQDYHNNGYFRKTLEYLAEYFDKFLIIVGGSLQRHTLILDLPDYDILNAYPITYKMASKAEETWSHAAFEDIIKYNHEIIEWDSITFLKQSDNLNKNLTVPENLCTPLKYKSANNRFQEIYNNLVEIYLSETEIEGENQYIVLGKNQKIETFKKAVELSVNLYLARRNKQQQELAKRNIQQESVKEKQVTDKDADQKELSSSSSDIEKQIIDKDSDQNESSSTSSETSSQDSEEENQIVPIEITPEENRIRFHVTNYILEEIAVFWTIHEKYKKNGISLANFAYPGGTIPALAFATDHLFGDKDGKISCSFQPLSLSISHSSKEIKPDSRPEPKTRRKPRRIPILERSLSSDKLEKDVPGQHLPVPVINQSHQSTSSTASSSEAVLGTSPSKTDNRQSVSALIEMSKSNRLGISNIDPLVLRLQRIEMLQQAADDRQKAAEEAEILIKAIEANARSVGVYQ